MKKTLTAALVLLLIAACATAGGEKDFETFFTDQTMRIDYFHIGDAESEVVTVDLVSVYGIWAGSRTRLLDPFDNGRYSIKIYDADDDSLLYSRGFDSYFGEYQTSGPAAEGVKRTFHETALVPAPKKPVRFALDRRDGDNRFREIFSQTIDPASIGINHDRIIDPDIQIIEAHLGGDPHTCVDIAIVGEGYTREEADKFKNDIRRHVDIIFTYEPYKSMKDAFNIRGVLKPSEESGVDEPRAGIFKNTSLNASFNALGSERYLLTEDNRALRDIAAHVPYDAVMIMVNHKRYGGGGIYNFYCTFTADTQFHEYIFIHEFGHSFTGLADEYYTSAVAYNEFYPRGVEPVEANITALLDPDNLKWKDLMEDGTPIPTPWEKDAFDTMDTAWQKERAGMNDRIAELKKTGAAADKIREAEEEYARRDREHSDKVDAYLEASRWRGKVGAYEGAGYSAEGLYRPMTDCIMFSKGSKPFCRVCEAAIRRVIESYLEQR
ncbi:MAG: IgA Peptidase M64 [Acidobacteria bacterium]|nr:IgA Peptidase M64 [Acidobacteriota bacterium]